MKFVAKKSFSISAPSLFPRRGANQGFIIVAVLWILGTLASLCSIYALYVANSVTNASVHNDRLQAEYLISAALELTAYQLTALKPDSRPMRGTFEFRMGRANVAAQFRSEDARVDLNAASGEMLAGLFAALGVQPADAIEYAAHIIAWRTKPTREREEEQAAVYRAAGLNYRPRGAPFPNVNELWLVQGLPSALVSRAVPYVTVFSGRPNVNLLDAPSKLVSALPGQAVSGLAVGRAMRVNVDIEFDNGRRTGAQVVILLLEGGEEPYRILSWRDDFDGLTVEQIGSWDQ